MTLVAGVDFGTQSVRVSVVDSRDGVIGHGVAPYPVVRSATDPDFATQSHDAHMSALVDAMRIVLADFKLLIEPSSAVAVAAVLAGKLGRRGEQVGLVISGGNLDLDLCPFLRGERL